MSEPPIDLGQIVGRDHRYELSVSNETPEDAAARRDKELADAVLRRKMNFALFLFALFMTAAVFAGCVWLFAFGAADDRKWAGGIVSAMTSGLIGYLVGQARK